MKKVKTEIAVSGKIIAALGFVTIAISMFMPWFKVIQGPQVVKNSADSAYPLLSMPEIGRDLEVHFRDSDIGIYSTVLLVLIIVFAALHISMLIAIILNNKASHVISVATFALGILLAIAFFVTVGHINKIMENAMMGLYDNFMGHSLGVYVYGIGVLAATIGANIKKNDYDKETDMSV